LVGAAALVATLTVAEPVAVAQDDAGARLESASQIQAATRTRLGVLGDAFSCPDARFVSYRRSEAEPEITDQWYVASQLYADAALIADNDETQDARCYVDKGFVFLDRLWDYTTSGYFPRSNPVGTSVTPDKRYTDDNLIAGLALLQTASTTDDPLAVQRYIHAATREADFLTGSGGVWDDTFGGGFWWNTGRGDTQEGKPAQTNALAALFFGRLYDATGIVAYRDWSLRSLLWLDTILWDPARQLYRWSVGYADIPSRTGASVHMRYFNYDQGIAIQAQLEALNLDGDQNRLARAEAIAHATHAAFWSQPLGGYNLEAGVEQVYTSYAAWTSLGFTALFAADADPTWPDLAQQNADALARRMREPDGGYAYRDYVCVDKQAQGCEAGPPTLVVDRVRDTSAQAWMQHLQTALAEAERPAPARLSDER
jgi:hypothetical protein